MPFDLRHPPYPPLRNTGLRLAKPEDLPRLGALSALGFNDSEIFRYARPRGEEFPDDAAASFSNWLRSQLLDPRAVMIVAEDWEEPESEKSSLSTAEPAVAGRKRVVVGVTVWYLPQGSPRTGQFVTLEVCDPAPCLDRDLCVSRLEIFRRAKDATDQK